VVSGLSFLARFTEVEREALGLAAIANPALAAFYQRVGAADVVDLDDPDIQDSIAGLVDAGLLSPGRRAEILASQTTEVRP
jgi:hypothetical protein